MKTRMTVTLDGSYILRGWNYSMLLHTSYNHVATSSRSTCFAHAAVGLIYIMRVANRAILQTCLEFVAHMSRSRHVHVTYTYVHVAGRNLSRLCHMHVPSNILHTMTYSHNHITHTTRSRHVQWRVIAPHDTNDCGLTTRHVISEIHGSAKM